MAGRGPAPKEVHSRERVQRQHDEEITTVEATGERYGPELPEIDGGWHERTLAWWETWRRSAQAQNFVGTDWDFLIDTALMHTTMWAKGRWEFAAELRLRAAKFGATPEDRARLKIAVVSNGPAKTSRTRSTGAGARKDRILNAVSDNA